MVTGASRGLGQAITVEFSKSNLSVQSMILISRGCLDETEASVSAAASGKSISVVKIHADLGQLETLDETIDKIVVAVEQQEFDRLIFVNNAGSLGFIGQAKDTPSLAGLRQTVDLNVTSALWMAIRMAKVSAISLLINISSLVAVQPFPSLALYSAGKAARDAFYQAMAAEGVQTLNYAPGPLETSMTEEIRSAEQLDTSLKPHYAKQLVDPRDSASALVELVEKGSFESGQHVDYFDIRPQR